MTGGLKIKGIQFLNYGYIFYRIRSAKSKQTMVRDHPLWTLEKLCQSVEKDVCTTKNDTHKHDNFLFV